MAQPPRESDSNYSFQLKLDIKGREKPTVWPWVVVVVVLVGSVALPLLKRLVGIPFF